MTSGAVTGDRIVLDADAIVRFASPAGELRKIFQPLWGVPPRPVRAVLEAALEDLRVRKLYTDLRELKRSADARLPDSPLNRDMMWLATQELDLRQAFESFHERLPRRWVELLSWGHWVAMYLLPPELPALRRAFEALLEVEPQLHVDAYHPNRDHVVHQIVDACLAAILYSRARATPDFDRADWECLTRAVDGVKDRERVTKAGLALAGLTHDVGYIRYIGAVARERLATVFGVVAPAPSIPSWDVTRMFRNTLLEHMLAHKDHGIDGIVADLYQTAWRRADHGPLSAFVLASVARGLRIEGRATPEIDAILQVAMAAAFLHELHSDDPKHDVAPPVIVEARTRIARFHWPAMFRIVDDLQCWFRPEMTATPDADGSHVTYGAESVEIEGGKLTIYGGLRDRGEKEKKALLHLKDNGGAHSTFAALGIHEIAFVPRYSKAPM